MQEENKLHSLGIILHNSIHAENQLCFPFCHAKGQ